MSERRLAAIMFTDIVGYTALMGKDEDSAFETLKRNHTIHITLINKHKGTLIKEIGDGTLASFLLASDAVRCAIDIQKEAKILNIPLKIGIHEGEMVFADADVLGDGVNVASRLQEISDEGCITISETVYRDIKNKAGIKTKLIGDKTLKNVDDPVKVYEVLCEEEINEEQKPNKADTQKTKKKYLYYILIGAVTVIATILIWYNLPNDQTPPLISDTQVSEVDKSIAVLPFTNDSPDEENEYFCNGMMEEILNQLQKISALKVKSRTSVEQYRNPTKNIKVIASELGVSYLVEGSVRKIGNDLRIVVQLIEGKTGDHLWSEIYDGEYSENIFKFQGDVAKKVATSLYMKIQPDELVRIYKRPTSNFESYDLMMKGYYYMKLYQTSGERKFFNNAESLFKQSVELDSNYIQGISGLALVCFHNGDLDALLKYAEKMIQLDPGETEGYYRRAYYYWNTNQPDKAIVDFKKAIELIPTTYYVYLNLGQVYITHKKDIRNGIKYFNKAFEAAKEINPQTDPNMFRLCGFAFSGIGDYKRAEKYYREALDWQVGCRGIGDYCFSLTSQGKFDEEQQFLDSICQVMECENICNVNRFMLNVHTKNWDEASRYYQLCAEDSGNLASWINLYWAYVLKKTGNIEEANSIARKELLTAEQQAGRNQGFSLYNLSGIYAFLNQKDKSLRYLREYENLEQAFNYYDYILLDPLYESLRDDLDFLEIVTRAQTEKTELRKQIKQLEEEGVL